MIYIRAQGSLFGTLILNAKCYRRHYSMSLTSMNQIRRDSLMHNLATEKEAMYYCFTSEKRNLILLFRSSGYLSPYSKKHVAFS